ncbi:MAG TPA: UDP-glucose 4-epimerase GalE [Thermomicrobiales bacterium]|nr:UDP-glucose 4-epimerase GalE [Thermomicrobiales bacterium]
MTGGGGYIGSVAVERLIDQGHEPMVLDSFWRGHRRAVPGGVPSFDVDLRDGERLQAIFREIRPDAVMHFAGATLVGESVQNPSAYFETNVVGGHHLLSAMQESGTKRLVFSSTAAVYGEPSTIPILEAAPTEPINPYGRSKLMVEQMLPWHEQAWGLRYVCFRYFNVAGATKDHGEDHDPETHLIPVALQALLGQRTHLSLFGTDYPTPDGTAIRDYVHVVDLVEAHLLALSRLGRSLGPVNLGTRDGFSVRQVIDAVERVTGRPVPVEVAPRRAGDPPALIADSTRARELLGWQPVHSTMDQMVASAWDWMQRHPTGYAQ